jgi:hypothetical protein
MHGSVSLQTCSERDAQSAERTVTQVSSTLLILGRLCVYTAGLASTCSYAGAGAAAAAAAAAHLKLHMMARSLSPVPPAPKTVCFVPFTKILHAHPHARQSAVFDRCVVQHHARTFGCKDLPN